MKKIIFYLALLASVNFSQTITGWKNYTNMKNVNGVAEKNGVVWAATEGGVFAIWQNDNSVLTLTKSEGLSSNVTTSIAIDSSNLIWIGTNEGYINVYDPTTNVTEVILDIYKTDRTIKTINEIKIYDDLAYISTEFGLIIINTNDRTINDYILKFGGFNSDTPTYGVFINDKIYVSTQAGLAYQKDGASNLTAPDSWLVDSLRVEISGSTFYNAVSFENKIYAGTNNGLQVKENGTWTTLDYSGQDVYKLDINNNSLIVLLENSVINQTSESSLFQNSNRTLNNFNFDVANNLIIGTTNGVILNSVDPNDALFPNGPPINSIESITVDSEGNLWTATGRDGNGIGVIKFDGSVWETFSIANTSVFESNSFHKVSHSENAVYFSNWGRGFARFKNNRFDQMGKTESGMTGITGSNTFVVTQDIKEDLNGNAWIINFWSDDKQPISVLTSDSNWYHYEFDAPLSAQIVYANLLEIDQYNTKWFAVTELGDEGLYYFNENGTFSNTNDDLWGKITVSAGLRDKDVQAIAVDKFGEIIIGTVNGVDVIPDPSTPSSIRNDLYYPLSQQTINAIAVDPINQKWFATEKGIFLTSSDGSVLINNFTKANSPLPTDNILDITIDDENGIVYASTDYGITAISTLFIEPNEDFSDMIAYPNPVRIKSNENANIVIDGLMENSSIKILDISGKLVNEFISIGGKTTPWDCKDSNGNLVGSGIYIIVAFDEEANEVGHTKIAVLRK